jgi:putative ABC transport system permease protein
MLSATMGFEAASREPLLAELVERVMGVPGVSQSGVASALPPDNSPIELEFRFVRRGQEESRRMHLVSATPGYFGALGIRLLAGRLFEPTDLGSDTPVAIVSDSAARFLAPEGDLLGRPVPVTLPVIRGQRIRPIVVGIVNDVKFAGLQSERSPAVYVPWRQLPASLSYLVVRAENPRAARPVIRQIIRDADPSLPDIAVRTLDEVFEGSIADRRLRAFPAVAFAFLALALSLVGLSATLFRSVAERRRELAVRLALGATPRRVISSVLGNAARLIAIGGMMGLLVAIVTTLGLSQFLYGVSAHDPWTFAAAVFVVTATSLLASLIPARRAARIDPLSALRAE